MTPSLVIAELPRLGPQSTAAAPSLAAARDYCRRLAKSHYENFSVASFLIPRGLRHHFHAVYAYCRWADDLADEAASPAESLELLDWWQHELLACYRGAARHPVFVALRATIEEFAIPQATFANLLTAFRRDQQQTAYDTFDELRDYCRCSADPVGRIVLRLARAFDEPRAELSDKICTGLQLANFCQDIARDWQRGRRYLPGETWRRHGYADAMMQARTTNAEFRAAVRDEVDRAEAWLRAGLPLADLVPRPFQVQIELFARGGLAILAAIRAIDYDVWRIRPTVGKAAKARLLLGAWWRRRVVPRSVCPGSVDRRSAAP
jgi:squalene synthase HpnC